MASRAPRRTASIAVLAFPDAPTAATVGPTLEHDDFTYKSGNEPVPIPDRPGTTAHWRPDTNAIVSWTVHDRYVVFVKVDDQTGPPELPHLVDQVRKMVDVQNPLLDKFQPTPQAELHTSRSIRRACSAGPFRATRTRPSARNPTATTPDGARCR